ncbi:MAG TPA: lipoate--protein ligase family protein [Acidimicrobiia bacterium]|jgi:lipoate-protein ligase A|nr:lipoate--protein ligase family protein [Acidimicrobiia bacterium]
MPHRIEILRTGYPERPGMDTALSHAILLRASAGELGETIRLHRPGPVVAFGRRDVVDPRFDAAVAATRAEGFEAVERLAGGRAAVFHRGTIAFAWAFPDAAPRDRVHHRFDRVAGVMADSLRRLGVDARIGEVPGEYCPGSHSVNVEGRRKVMGVGQRLVARAAHVGGVIVVDGAAEVRRVLSPVYRELGISWDPDTTGDLASILPGIDLEKVVGAVLDRVAEEAELVEVEPDPETLALSERLAPRHIVDRSAQPVPKVSASLTAEKE